MQYNGLQFLNEWLPKGPRLNVGAAKMVFLFKYGTISILNGFILLLRYQGSYMSKRKSIFLTVNFLWSKMSHFLAKLSCPQENT